MLRMRIVMPIFKMSAVVRSLREAILLLMLFSYFHLTGVAGVQKEACNLHQSRSSVPKSRFSRKSFVSTSGIPRKIGVSSVRSISTIQPLGLFPPRSARSYLKSSFHQLLYGISFNLTKIWDFSQHCLITSVFNITLFFKKTHSHTTSPNLHRMLGLHTSRIC